MGLIGNLVGAPAAVTALGEAAKGVAEVFTPSATRKMELSAEAQMAALRQLGEEYQHPALSWFDRMVNGLNRLPRPFLAFGTIGLFVYAMVDPVAFVSDTLQHAGADMLIFTTELYEGTVPKPEEWWYYAFATGQHIGFFKRQTLHAIGNRLGLQFYSANGLHIFSREAVNPRIFNWATGRWTAQIGARWIRRRLGSKTVSDHEDILRFCGSQVGIESPP